MPSKKAPGPKPAKKKGVLSPQMETFSAELAKGTSQAEAYRIAYPKSRNWTPKTVINRASELAAHGGVLGRVEELRAIAAKANEVGVTEVLAWHLDILRADPRKLIEIRRVPCRYCHGDGHRYQHTPAEFEEAQRKHALLQAEKPLIGEFNPRGGIGYDRRKSPHPDCPECFGEGVEHIVAGDARRFSPQELALYEGVEVTKDGLKVKTASREASRQAVARHVGFFEKDNEVQVGVFDAGTLEAKFRAGIEKSMERQAAIVAERRRNRAER